MSIPQVYAHVDVHPAVARVRSLSDDRPAPDRRYQLLAISPYHVTDAEKSCGSSAGCRQGVFALLACALIGGIGAGLQESTALAEAKPLLEPTIDARAVVDKFNRAGFWADGSDGRVLWPEMHNAMGSYLADTFICESSALLLLHEPTFTFLAACDLSAPCPRR